MTLLEAIQSRHSVRHYISQPLSQEVVDALQAKIDECNRNGNLHIQLVLNEKKGFSGMMAYGSFSGVENYLVMAGAPSNSPKGERADHLQSFDERIGYYGEQIVLLAEQLGLGTCWAGLSYRKVKGTYELDGKEKVACMISLGYPNDPGRNMKKKSVKELSNVSDASTGLSTGATPEWFRKGVEAARLAPTAINQQKFYFEYIHPHGDASTGSAQVHKVKATRGFSMVGYTQMDLGIAKLHFEIGAGKDNFTWV